MKLSKLNIVDDVELYKDSLGKNEKFFLSSASKEIYIKLNREQFYFLKVLIPHLNGEKSKVEIENQLSNLIGEKVDITDAILMLKEHSLLENADYKKKSRVEMELYSRNVKIIKVSWLNDIKRSIIEKIIRIWFLLAVVNFTIFALFFIKDGYIHKFIQVGIKWKNINFLSLAFIYIISWLSILFHELGHVIVAMYYKVHVESINFVLKFGVIPSFYVKYKNLYTVKSAYRLKILFGGVFHNQVLISLFGTLYFFYNDWKMLIIVILNLYDIISNLCPLTCSDGYYIISTALGKEGFRWELLEKISRILKGEYVFDKSVLKDNYSFLCYFCVSVIITIVSLKKLIIGTFVFFRINVNNFWVGCLVSIFILLKILGGVKKAIKKIRLMN